MFRLKKWYLKQKGYFCHVGETWDNNDLSPENIHSYVDRVLEYETETRRNGHLTKEYILASSGEKINEDLINFYLTKKKKKRWIRAF